MRRQQARRPPDRRQPGRDFAFEEMDVRSVEAGDLAPGGHPIEIEPAIEVGQIFKLGTRYSEPLGATYLDEDGAERPIVMGSYGIGPARTVAAAIEQNADERGIVWPRSSRPGTSTWSGSGRPATRSSEAAERLYGELRDAGARGRLRRSRRGARGEADRRRAARAARCGSWSASERSRRGPSRRRPAGPGPTSACRSPRRRPARASCSMVSSRRRLFGLDRSGPKPSETRRGQPLRPADDPEPGRLRAARRDPRVPLPGAQVERRAHRGLGDPVLAISAGDYLDGFLARVTGQYSRMGALLDPMVDRLTILAGVVVCWRFELLPRWALAVLAARELVTLVLAQLGAAPRGGPRDQLGRAEVGVADHGRHLPGPGDGRLGRDRDVPRRPRGLAPRLGPLLEERPRRGAPDDIEPEPG